MNLKNNILAFFILSVLLTNANATYKTILGKNGLPKVVSEYNYAGDKLESEYFFKYDKNATKKQDYKIRIRKRYNYSTGYLEAEEKRTKKYKIYDLFYFEDGQLSRAIYYDKSKYSHKIEEKTWYKNGKPYYWMNFVNDRKIVRHYNKNGTLKKKESFMIHYSDEYKDGWSEYYDKKGNLQEEIFYELDKYKYQANCRFSVQKYIKRLRTKHYKDIYIKLIPDDISCISLDVNKRILVQSFTNEKTSHKALLIALLNIKQKKILDSIYDTKTKLFGDSSVEIASNSYTSLNLIDAFDIVAKERISKWEYKESFQTYKIKNNKIQSIKSILNLNDFIQKAKNGEEIHIETMKTMLYENKITKQNVTTYNNIAYYLQKNKDNYFHNESEYLLQEILNIFPNRAVAMLNIADSQWILNKKDNYFNI